MTREGVNEHAEPAADDREEKRKWKDGMRIESEGKCLALIKRGVLSLHELTRANLR